jgi:hypothetical protein
MARTARTRRIDSDPIETNLNRQARVARIQGLRQSNAGPHPLAKRRPKGGRQGIKIETRRAVFA